MGQAGCGDQKPLEPAMLPLVTFSAWSLTPCLLPYSRILMSKSWAAFVPGPTGLSGERKHGGLGFNYKRGTSPWRLLSFALGRDFQATVSWIYAIYTEGKGLLCRSAFPSPGDSHRTVLAQSQGMLPGWLQELPGMFCSPVHCMVALLPT